MTETPEKRENTNEKQNKKSGKLHIITTALLLGTLSLTSPAKADSSKKDIDKIKGKNAISLNQKQTTPKQEIQIYREIIEEIEEENEYEFPEELSDQKIDYIKTKIFEYLKQRYHQEDTEYQEYIEKIQYHQQKKEEAEEEIRQAQQYLDKTVNESTETKSQRQITTTLVQNILRFNKSHKEEHQEQIDYYKLLIKKDIEEIIKNLRENYTELTNYKY